MMKTFQVVLLLVLSLAYLVQGKLGTFSCTNKNLVPDADMEKTIGVKCPLDMDNLDLNSLDPSKPMTEAEITKLLGPAFGAHFKCMFGVIKAIDAKGKIIPKAAAAFDACFVPANYKKKVSAKVSQCIQKHNPELKKETGKSGKSWAGISICIMMAIEMGCVE